MSSSLDIVDSRATLGQFYDRTVNVNVCPFLMSGHDNAIIRGIIYSHLNQNVPSQSCLDPINSLSQSRGHIVTNIMERTSASVLSIS